MIIMYLDPGGSHFSDDLTLMLLRRVNTIISSLAWALYAGGMSGLLTM